MLTLQRSVLHPLLFAQGGVLTTSLKLLEERYALRGSNIRFQHNLASMLNSGFHPQP
jgi:hypothetical protein